MSNTPKHTNGTQKKTRSVVLFILITALILGGVFLFSKSEFSLWNPTEKILVDVSDEDDFDKIKDGIHIRTGFVDAPGLMETVRNCTTCHSSQLVLQNRMNKEQWTATIKWMQETQNLWDLGKNEAIIIDYLVTNYPPKKTGRRENLNYIDWYVLKE